MSPSPLDSQSLHDLIRAEFLSRQERLLKDVKASVADALKNDQRALVLASQQKDEKKSHTWDFWQIVITALVGLGVWYTQSSLSDKLTTTNQAISTRYTLTQEYYKERFKTYKATYEQLTVLDNALAMAVQHPRTIEDAVSAKEKLDEERNRSELYYSPEIRKKLEDISYQAAQVPPVDPSGTGKLRDLEQKIEVAKAAMYEEVTKGDIGSFAGKP